MKDSNSGGNDLLAAYVSEIAKADLLINMSDVDGLYDANPRTNPNAKLIARVEKFDDAIMKMAGGAGTERGTAA